ncbi:MAG TPA: indolepyruvate ferredoxin oxidoreductase [Candidatus Wirthbacteria bacterium]|nr:indolepyruvate ferredoxin oxidoreductase [Candidatus Wirthbacteria bacterium]
MAQKILLGDEAVAQAALDAGISCAYSYPGTPSTEIMAYIQKHNPQQIRANWCPNEKVALEEALGVSYSGCRCLVSMKHVGLNVAADPFLNASLIKINGGLVLAVADDPGIHSSQNEQDSRIYAEFAQVICLEPTDLQQCYDLTRQAFELSEQNQMPVLLRLVTRLAHSRSGLELEGSIPIINTNHDSSRQDWVLIPKTSVRLNQELRHNYQALAVGQTEGNNNQTVATQQSLGIIASGIGVNYAQEACSSLGINPDLHMINFYPANLARIREFIDQHDQILIVEEGSPWLENKIRGLGRENEMIKGKIDGSLPPTGELNTEMLLSFLSEDSCQKSAGATNLKIKLPARPPQLCQGCSHRDVFRALQKVRANYDSVRIFGDIGCYALGYAPPFELIDTIVCMGASIGMAKGAADATSCKTIAVIGDSTFLHTGMQALLDAAKHQANILVCILNNSTTAMTGGQPLHLDGEQLPKLVLALGVEQEHLLLEEALPSRVDELAELLTLELEYKGVSVLIANRPCIQIARGR